MQGGWGLFIKIMQRDDAYDEFLSWLCLFWFDVRALTFLELCRKQLCTAISNVNVLLDVSLIVVFWSCLHSVRA